MDVFNIKRFLKKSIFLTILLLAVFIDQANAQKFKGNVVFGMNLSQIDGDDLAGYSKLGWTGGVKLGYPMKEKIDLNMELLYSQRGSNSGFGFGGIGDLFTDLQYLEIPVYVNFQDWLIEDEDYYKVKVHGGLNFSYLFGVESSNGAVSNDIDTYKRNNVGFLIGLDYSFTKRVGFTVRYSRDFNSITDNKAISYYITLRTEYSF